MLRTSKATYLFLDLMNYMQFNSSQLEMLMLFLSDDSIPRLTLQNGHVQNLLKSNQRFDIVIVEVTMAESLLGFGHFYKAPTILIQPVGSNYISNRIVGNSEPLAYVPIQMGPLTDEMTFLQRLLNTLAVIITRPIYTFISLPLQEEMLQHFFPDAPTVDDLLKNVSIILLNAHHSIVETPRPYMPNMIPVGGLHVQPQNLPHDLKVYLDEAKHGAVLFSLGSNARSADLPPEKIKIILNTFSSFKQRFLWKFENESLLDVPDNVKIKKWLPQRAVLGMCLEQINRYIYWSMDGIVFSTSERESVY